MLKAIYYKEWIKTHRMVGLLAILFIALLVYSFITINQSFRLLGSVQAWNAYLLKDIVLLSHLKWTPLLAGLILALSQFIPEMVNQRLKLTLHLPLPESRTISYLLSYGLIVLGGLFVISYIALWGMLRYYYPAEITGSVLVTTLPWFIAGIPAYLLTSWIAMESKWRQRIGNGIAAVCFLAYFFIDAIPGGYTPFIPFLVVLTLISFAFPFFSARRFKEGVGVR